ncbi:uncharacterized protein EV154DRAFT_519301, partial [Mucor mucedo]|uniref:uncharacterized protein n=1 Tax=Mucor mucedo TaxID=29922 RepID=UPI00221E745B
KHSYLYQSNRQCLAQGAVRKYFVFFNSFNQLCIKHSQELLKPGPTAILLGMPPLLLKKARYFFGKYFIKSFQAAKSFSFFQPILVLLSGGILDNNSAVSYRHVVVVPLVIEILVTATTIIFLHINSLANGRILLKIVKHRKSGSFFFVCSVHQLLSHTIQQCDVLMGQTQI